MSSQHIPAINEILTNLQYDPSNESIQDTPKRFASYLQRFEKNTNDTFIEFCKKKNIYATQLQHLTLPVTITLEKISVNTMCKHHMLPFYGEVTITYKTIGGYTLGLSKFKRIIDYTSSELTSQEELTHAIVNNISKILPFEYMNIKVQCSHTCMILRGVKDLNTKTTTELTKVSNTIASVEPLVPSIINV